MNARIFVLSLALAIYNLPLGILCLVYFGLTSLLNKTFVLDLLILITVIIIAIITFDFAALSAQIKFVSHYYSEHGLLALIDYQLINWHNLLYQHGFSLLIIIPLTMRILDAYRQKNTPITLQAANVSNHGTLLNDTLLPPYVIADNELNQHCLIIGTTGAGKTSTMLHFVLQQAKNNIPIIYIDGKGSIDLIDKLQQIADQHQRVFKVFNLRQRPNLTNAAGYNPFASGTATEWTNRIMALFTQASSRGQEHFSLQEQNYINFVAKILYQHGKLVDLRMFLALLEQPEKLLKLAQRVDPIIAMKLAALHNDSNINHMVNDVVKLLEIFIYSDYGHLFNTKELNNVINLRESILNKEIVLFLFDASSYPEDTKKVARMVINDINSCFADFTAFTKCLCVFDEFASYASDNLSDIISLQRSKGMHAIIGTQSIVTVKLKSENTKRVAEELLACCNTFIIHRINHSEDAEILANIIGSQKTYSTTIHIDDQSEADANKHSLKLVDEYKIHPQLLKELQTGEAVIYRKASAAPIPPQKIKIMASLYS
mgnify:CR=1 FL=1